MELELTTPALLFSTTSLLMLAYTNRFLSTAKLIRDLHDKYQTKQEQRILKQIRNLKRRIALIRNMQLLSVGTLLLSVLCMLFLFVAHNQFAAKAIFAGSLMTMCVSLIFSVWEILISIKALNWEIHDIEAENKSLIDKVIEVDKWLDRDKED